MNEADFLAAHTASLSPLERALAGDAARDALADADDRRKEAERAAAAQERAELLQLACYRGGVQPGELQRLRSLAAETDDEIHNLQAQLERAEAKRSRVTGNLEALMTQLDLISRAVAVRSSAPVDLYAPAKAALAEHRAYVARSRQLWQAAQNGKRESRPFAGGVAVRGEPGDVECDACKAVGATPAESFWIHHSGPDGEPLAGSPEVPVRVPDDDSERSAAGHRREIRR
jgi:hypothetical protein